MTDATGAVWGPFWGDQAPLPLTSYAPWLLVTLTFNGYGEVYRDGFSAQFSALDACPGSCTGRGDCYVASGQAPRCLCYAGYAGPDCSGAPQARQLFTTSSIAAPLDAYEWVYFLWSRLVCSAYLFSPGIFTEDSFSFLFLGT